MKTMEQFMDAVKQIPEGEISKESVKEKLLAWLGDDVEDDVEENKYPEDKLSLKNLQPLIKPTGDIGLPHDIFKHVIAIAVDQAIEQTEKIKQLDDFSKVILSWDEKEEGLFSTAITGPLIAAVSQGNIDNVKEILQIAENTQCLKYVFKSLKTTAFQLAIDKKDINSIQALWDAARRGGPLFTVEVFNKKNIFQMIGLEKNNPNPVLTPWIVKEAIANNCLSDVLNWESDDKSILKIIAARSVENNNFDMLKFILQELQNKNQIHECINDLYLLSNRFPVLKSLFIDNGVDPDMLETVKTVKRHTHLLGMKGKKTIILGEKKLIIKAEGERFESALIWYREFTKKQKPELVDAINFCEKARTSSDSEESRGRINQELQERIENKKPVYLNLGWKGHAIALWIHNGKIILTNRGQGALQPCGTRIYKMPEDPSKLFDFLNTCFYPDTDTLKENNVLNALNDFIPPENLISYIPQKEQKVGNCSYVNPKASLAAFFALENEANNDSYMKQLTALFEKRNNKALSLHEWLQNKNNYSSVNQLWKSSHERARYKNMTTSERVEIIDGFTKKIQSNPEDSFYEKSMILDYFQDQLGKKQMSERVWLFLHGILRLAKTKTAGIAERLPEVLNAKDSQDNTPLLCAIKNHNDDAVKIIIHAAKIAKCLPDVLNAKDLAGNTPLIHAVISNNAGAIRSILHAAAEIASPAILNASFYAVRYNKDYAIQTIIREAKKIPGYLPKLLNAKDEQGNTLLFNAVKNNNAEIISIILQAAQEADCLSQIYNEKNNDNEDILQYAKKPKSKIYAMLLQAQQGVGEPLPTQQRGKKIWAWFQRKSQKSQILEQENAVNKFRPKGPRINN